MSLFPPTIFVVHPREKRSKCTVEFLRGRPGFVFRDFPVTPPIDCSGYVRLGIGGPVLTNADADRGLLILDGTWRLAERMVPFYKDVPIRSLPPWKSAYPRVSKHFVDPQGGLATIEALYAAYAILGRDTMGLLANYFWREEFVRLNSLPPDRLTC
ncbi:MAG: hypothetical protein ACKVT0_08600 [Planctomycetaceae bacterium]